MGHPPWYSGGQRATSPVAPRSAANRARTRRCQMTANPRTILSARAFLAVAFAGALLLASSALGASKYRVLHNSGSGGDGSGPFGPPILDDKGNLYGVTGSGGTGKCSDYGCGTVFEVEHR